MDPNELGVAVLVIATLYKVYVGLVLVLYSLINVHFIYTDINYFLEGLLAYITLGILQRKSKSNKGEQ